MHGRMFRNDIQVLRGVAVLAVVIFHAFKDEFPKGFLGVDIFFVISGFLITGHIMKGLEEGTFSFKDFYLRRARRLLPASLSTLAVASAIALVILTPKELAEYGSQALGVLTFTANFVLMFQTDYFGTAAEMKPLLHTWSLSLEEQFYFVAPLLLWLTPLRARPWLLLAGTGLSAALCYVLLSTDLLFSPTENTRIAFFMLPARAWELLLGSLVAWVMLRRPKLAVPAWIKHLALAVIVVVCTFGYSDIHPGPDAIAVTVATAVLLLGQDGWLHDNVLTRAMERIGDWSYSIYLVHWPLFSFATITYIGEPPVPVLIALAIISIALGALQYRYVEQPFRKPGSAWRLTVPVGALAVAAAAPAAASGNAETPQNVGLSAVCVQDDRFVRHSQCRTAPEPEVLLWGDSHAMMFASALRGLAFEQATKAACAPVLGVAQIKGAKYSDIWARDCIAFNSGVIEALDEMAAVRTVVLVSRWVQVFSPDYDLVVDGQVGPWSAVAGERLIGMIEAIQASGRRVVLIGPTAEADFDVGRCIEREKAAQLILRPTGCSVAAQKVRRNIGEVERALKRISHQTGAVFISPADATCGAVVCVTADGESLYRDAEHLTDAGVAYVTRRAGLMRAILPASAEKGSKGIGATLPPSTPESRQTGARRQLRR